MFDDCNQNYLDRVLLHVIATPPKTASDATVRKVMYETTCGKTYGLLVCNLWTFSMQYVDERYRLIVCNPWTIRQRTSNVHQRPFITTLYTIIKSPKHNTSWPQQRAT